MIDATEQAVRHALASHTPRDVIDVLAPERRLDAGVLVPLRLQPTPTVTLVVRSASLHLHAGEVGFPGGKPEAQDRDLEATALREAAEEIGLLPGDVEILGKLTPIPVGTSHFRLNPFVGLIQRTAPWIPSRELAEAVDVPLREFEDGTVGYRTQVMSWAGRELRVPVFTLRGGKLMYGASAFVLQELLLVLGPCVGIRLPE